jgi:hypothetical protein
MKTHPLGSAGPPVSALAPGCMGMSDWYGLADEAESIATIHAAIDAGAAGLTHGGARRVRQQRGSGRGSC